MIGLVIVSHGRLADALLETASEIVGPFERARALAVSRSENLSDIEERIRAAVRQVSEGAGVLILADMFGGTAANVALQLVGEHHVEVVTGANLPMLLKFATAIDSATDLASLAQLLKFFGQRNVLVASELLKEREQDG
ncbi:MAG: PTS sugar transporter subunit IIA [Myxococcales bacterium]|nr:PTS sugar transporter subunit IIA [Myxococcales bacterium]